MSLVDWAAESRERYRTQSLTAATTDSAREFWAGLLDRIMFLKIRQNGWLETEFLGESVEFTCTSPIDVKRANDLLGELPVVEWLFEDVDTGTIVWDVGAFQGHYAVIASSLGGDVVAFEPVDENRSQCRRHVRRNDVDERVDVLPFGLSDRSGQQRLSPAASESMFADGGTELVSTMRGDSVDPKPDIAKIDVEGHEIAVLEGMKDALLTVDRVAVEVHDGSMVDAVTDLLEQAGLSTTTLATDRSQTYVGGVRR